MQLKPGELSQAVDAALERGRCSGVLKPIETAEHVVSDGGVDFVVRQVQNLARKDAETRQVVDDQDASTGPRQPKAVRREPPDYDPFLPWEPELYVGHLSTGHVAILNKFPVIHRHFLVVTPEFEPQTSPISSADFAAAWLALRDVDGLLFYNAGSVAGASQPHKHLQIAPYPLTKASAAPPIEAVLPSASSHTVIARDEPFRFGLVWLEPEIFGSSQITANEASEKLTGLYERLMECQGMDLSKAPDSSPGDSFPGYSFPGYYNLVLTRRWMMVVPRVVEHVAEMSINGLGFAGGLFVRRTEQLARIRQLGPCSLLRRATLDP